MEFKKWQYSWPFCDQSIEKVCFGGYLSSMCLVEAIEVECVVLACRIRVCVRYCKKWVVLFDKHLWHKPRV